jgi:glycosyltransferase involved in cell wall biosynthesis
MLAISLVTLGSPDQLTGGYLYHRRMAEAAPGHDARVRFVAVPDLPFPLPALTGRAVMKRALPADVIVIDSIAAAYVAPAVWPRYGGPPVVASMHQPPGGIDHGRLRAGPQAVLDRVLYRRAARLIAASQALAGELAGEGFSAGVIRVVAPGCDVPAAPDATPPELRRGRRAAFLSVGNWVARKGTLDLLEAVSRLPADAATLHLVGRHDVDRGYAARVRRRLSEPDMAGRVVVHGPLPREQVALLYRAADAFVVPSRREPYGTVYGEAMAAGLPVAGWRAGNLPHLADDGKEGVVVEPGDIAALAAGLSRLAGDAAYRHRMATQAAARARSLPTWAQSAAAFFGVLNEVAPRDARSAR